MIQMFGLTFFSIFILTSFNFIFCLHYLFFLSSSVFYSTFLLIHYFDLFSHLLDPYNSSFIFIFSNSTTLCGSPTVPYFLYSFSFRPVLDGIRFSYFYWFTRSISKCDFKGAHLFAVTSNYLLGSTQCWHMFGCLIRDVVLHVSSWII